MAMVLCALTVLLTAHSCTENEEPKPNPTPPNGEEERPVYPDSMASGTLPLMYINTENGDSIVDKETKIPAGMYITVPEGYGGYEGLASAENPAELTIKGRGNASWLLPQKPYKVKFEKKTEVLGMPRHKHFALIPFAAGYADWLAAYAGFELGRMAGMAWTPRMEPVELVLNGNYEGLYFVVESMKIDSKRLDIFEQEDLCEDPSLITGGWLVEIDNYNDPAQITIPETGNIRLRVTYKTPEELSPVQKDYLTEQFTAMNAAIYSGDPTGNAWAEYIDAHSVARYFIVRELLHDTDGYNGSFYLHKDLGDNEKWHFGPLWDVCYGGLKNDWIMNDHPAYSLVHWIGAIFGTEAFRKALAEEWQAFYAKLPAIYPYVEELAERCAAADEANHLRWPESSKNNTPGKLRYLRSGIENNSQWMNERIMQMSGIDGVVADDNETTEVRRYYNLQGISEPEENLLHGPYIRVDGKGAKKIIR